MYALGRIRHSAVKSTFKRSIFTNLTLSSVLPLKKSNWTKAVSNAENLVHPAGGGSVINPKQLLGKDLELITFNIKKLLGSGHPILNTVSSYYFSQKGKHIRPLIVLLMAQATSMTRKTDHILVSQHTLDTPISYNFKNTNEVADDQLILPSQRRLAEITEMIHTASLLHDDVIDNSLQRRSSPSANAEYGNKMAILAGDFLLARASVALARLRDIHVVELLATVIANLVEGEFMQLRNSLSENGELSGKFDYYLDKTYLKTASLIAKSCQASAILGGTTAEVADIAYLYGRNIGLAFQLIDDMLDFISSSESLGKPSNADLKLGLATAPVLYAAETHPSLIPLIERKFSVEGDVETAFESVSKSNGIQRTLELAKSYVALAVEHVSKLPPSDARDALVDLTVGVLERKK